MANVTDSASLLTIPSGWDDGVLGSLKPDDGTGDFTFSRGSDLSATRVNEDGHIEKAYENLLYGSNTLNNLSYWTQDAIDVPTGGQLGYDGSNDAWLVNKTSTANASVINSAPLPIGSVSTLSFYAKSGTANCIDAYLGGTARIAVNLDTGSTYLLVGDIDYSITDAGNGYKKIVFTYISVLSTFRYQINNNNAGSATGSIYLQNFQINQGLVAYPYIESTTTTAKSTTILENQPRIDYSNGANGNILVEPQRTNLIAHSEFYSFYGGWRIIQLTPEYGYGISPEGLKNSVKISQSSISSARIESVSALSLSAGADYTFSFFIKNIDANLTYITGTSGTPYEINWNGATISSVTTGLKYKDFGNGWYRVWETSASSGSTIYRIYPDRTSPYTGSVEVYGTQAENSGMGGSLTHPTSYIPTYGTSQTRLKETATLTKNVASTGTIYINIEAQKSRTLTFLGANISVTAGTNKIAMSYSPTALKVSHNGSIVANTARTFDTASLTQIQLGHRNNFEQTTDGINQFLTLDSFLSDADLNALTI